MPNIKLHNRSNTNTPVHFTEGDYGGHGNSFYGDGGYQTRRAQLRFTIRVLLAVVRTGNENVLQDLCDQGLIDALKGIMSCITVVTINYILS